MRASCKLAAQVLEYAGTLVKVSLTAPFVLRPASSDLNLLAHGTCSHSCSRGSCICSPQLVAPELLCCALQPGVSTDAIDKLVHKMIVQNDAYPSPLTYGGCRAAAQCT